MATETNSCSPATPSPGWFPFRWIQRTFFSTWGNASLTILLAFIIYYVTSSLLDWGLLRATFAGRTRAGCTPAGACWPFISVHFAQFVYGHFPQAERWRVNIVFALLILTMAPVIVPGPRKKWYLWLGPTALFPCTSGILLIGGIFGLPHVPTDQWGGLMLTLALSYSAILGSLPLGILLALGRRSRLPLVRTVSVALIEFFRGVPLITILFTSLFILPIVLPEGVTLDKLGRATVALMFFYGAYIAEVVRGGLQALPRSQYEAAEALGLGYWKSHALVIIPQALRLVIPGIMNIMIGLLKDSTLVTIIGLFDILGIAKQALGDPEWVGLSSEAYLFVSIVFFLACFAMSTYSQKLERRIQLSRAGY
jgi:general L-amino acid transport system permease protein